ncbi:hypothetical protein HF086_007818, partial [Spodoptera exigua]
TEYLRAHEYANGFTIVVDYRGLNILQLATRMSTADVQQFINVLIEGYGARLKNVHIITESKAVELLVSTVKQFISEKIAEWVDELSSEKHIDYLKMIYKACTDESKRPIEKFNEEYMGMPGSFRNLTVD